MSKQNKIEDLTNYENYLNRELSLIEFNRRVLEEAKNLEHPLLERLKFATIFSSNLDEFFMIRVAGLKSQVAAGINDRISYDGQTPQQQLNNIRKLLIPLYKEQEKILLEQLLPELEQNGVNIYNLRTIQSVYEEQIEKYFLENILPVLTPLTIDSTHPFPRLINRTLNIAFVLRDQNNNSKKNRLAFLQIPNILPRFIELDSKENGNYNFVLIESIIIKYSEYLFPGMEIKAANSFRVTRDADIEIAEDEAEDLLEEIEEQVKQRKWGRAAVRLEVSHNMPVYLVELLKLTLGLDGNDIYVVKRPLNLSDFMYLTKLNLVDLKDSSFTPRTPSELTNSDLSIFDLIRKKDFLVHHPFDSFSNTTSRFIQEAAIDKDVIAIKITLYRAGGNSSIIESLKTAAENGKDVTAFVELKARFDEENNIVWARELENSGVHCVYGIIGYKTHCKIAMVIRKESEKLKTYVHLSTGNYNENTAKLYTDVAIFSSREKYALDAVHLFNYLTGYSHYANWSKFIVAPNDLEKKLIYMIEREAKNHTSENPGLIIAKMNSLAHREVIRTLYKASQKGVKIKLIVRGICCLLPGIEGLSENIEVKSIIGRFLEHSRIFYFRNAGEDEYYIGSADWMTRNLMKRVELMIPISQQDIKEELKNILDIYLSDNVKSWTLNSKGQYEKIKPQSGENLISAQKYFLNDQKIL